MGQKYIVGIDVGSQSAKILIYDLKGNIAARGRKKLAPMHLAEPGIVEHPDDDFREIRRTLSESESEESGAAERCLKGMARWLSQ